jgi:YD repeat-containing protein
VSATNQSVAAGASVPAASFFSGSDHPDNPITWYQLTNTGDGGGYFELNGKPQAVGSPFYVSKDQLSQLTYVAGTTGTADVVQVSAFDGAIWSASASFDIGVGASSSIFHATGPDQSVTGGSTGADTIVGGYDGDTLVGGTGQDTFEYTGGGAETISETAPNTATSDNTLQFGSGITPAALTWSAASGELILRLGNGDSVTLEGVDLADPLGSARIQSFTFADGSQLTLEELLTGSQVTGSSGTVTNADGSQTLYTFSPGTDPAYTAQTLNAQGQLTRQFRLGSDGSSSADSYTYGSDGSYTHTIVSTPSTAPGPTTTVYSYDSTGHLLSEDVQNPDGSQTSYSYNAQGQLIGANVTNSDGSTSDSTLSYNPDGSYTNSVVTAPASGPATTTVYSYDGQGHLLSENVTNPDGSTADYSYNAQGQLTGADVSNADGSTSDSTLSYAADGSHTNTVVTTSSGGASTTTVYGYDAQGDLLSEQLRNPDGSTADYTYNAQGQLTSADLANADGSSNESALSYNPDGSYTNTVVTTPMGGASTTTVYGYDGQGHLLSEDVNSPDGSIADYTYNTQGQLTGADLTSTDGSLSDSTLSYNADGSYTNTVVTTPSGGAATTTAYGYDGAGHLLSEDVNEPNGSQADYTYNPLGQILSADLTSEDGSTSNSTYSYNADGSYSDTVVLAAEGGAATTTAYYYDTQGELLEENVQNPDSSSAQYAYDNQGRLLGANITHSNGSTNDSSFSYSYDGSYTDTVIAALAGGASATTTVYGYDSQGHLLSQDVHSPGGSTAHYSYNAQGQLTSADITDAGGSTNDSEYVYNGDGSYTDTVRSTPAGGGAAAIVVYGYDSQGHLLSENLSNADGSTADYVYNAQGQITSSVVTGADGSTSDSSYSYAADGSYSDQVVATAVGASASTTSVYNYDSQGNLLSQNLYTPEDDGSYTDSWSKVDGSYGTYWWNSSTLEYQDNWHNADASYWSDDYQFSPGGSPTTAGPSYTETYQASDGSEGTRQFDGASDTTSLTWYSGAAGTLTGTTADAGFLGLQADDETRNTQPDLTFFNPNVSPGFSAFLAAHGG